MKELQMPHIGPTKLYSDSQSAINIVKNPIQHDRMKHVRIDRHFIKSEIEDGGIQLCFIPTHSQEADVLTKTLSRTVFEDIISKLGMIDIYSSA